MPETNSRWVHGKWAEKRGRIKESKRYPAVLPVKKKRARQALAHLIICPELAAYSLTRETRLAGFPHPIAEPTVQAVDFS